MPFLVLLNNQISEIKLYLFRYMAVQLGLTSYLRDIGV